MAVAPGLARPARHQLRARKDGRSRAQLQGAQNGGRGGPGERAGESPTQRKRDFPSSVAVSCDPAVLGRRPGTSMSPWRLGALLPGEGIWSPGVSSLGGWRLVCEASLALVVILLGICPFELGPWLILKPLDGGSHKGIFELPF
jgi:hypothetical protein